MSTGEWDLTGIFRALNGPLVTDPDCPDQGVGWILAAGSLLKTIVLGGGVWEPVEIFFSNLAGAGPSAGFKLGCEAQAARMEAYGRIFEGLIENLDWDTANLSELLAIADDYLGPVSEPLCDEAVEEAHRSLMKLYIALAFRPDKEDAYLSIAEQMGAPLAAPSCD